MKILEPERGKVIQKLEVKAWSRMIADGRCVYLQSFHDNTEGYRIGAVDVAAGRLLWDVSVPIDLSSAALEPEPLTVLNGQVIIRTYNGTVYALDVADGRMIWRVTAGGFPIEGGRTAELGASVVLNGRLWIQAGDEVHRVEFHE